MDTFRDVREALAAAPPSRWRTRLLEVLDALDLAEEVCEFLFEDVDRDNLSSDTLGALWLWQTKRVHRTMKVLQEINPDGHI